MAPAALPLPDISSPTSPASLALFISALYNNCITTSKLVLVFNRRMAVHACEHARNLLGLTTNHQLSICLPVSCAQKYTNRTNRGYTRIVYCSRIRAVYYRFSHLTELIPRPNILRVSFSLKFHCPSLFSETDRSLLILTCRHWNNVLCFGQPE